MRKNKKLQMRMQIKELAEGKSVAERKLRNTQVDLSNAEQIALDKFARSSDLYKHVFMECAHGAGKTLGEELNKHKDKILGMIVKEMPRLYLNHDIVKNEKIAQVTIPLKDVHYCMRLGVRL